jgi:hypothetical protein
MAPVRTRIEVLLSPPMVWVSLSGCEDSENQQYCTGDPELVFKGEEPLPNESIIHISGNVAGTPFSCDGDECRVKLSATAPQGALVTFLGELWRFDGSFYSLRQGDPPRTCLYPLRVNPEPFLLG